MTDGDEGIEFAPEHIRQALSHAAPSPEKRILLGHAARGFFALDTYPHPPMDTGVDPINRPGAVLLTMYGSRGPWQVVGKTVKDFVDWLHTGGITVDVREVLRVLNGMHRIGLLIAYGIDTDQTEFGQVYVSYPTGSSQDHGNLWLSEVLGGELIVPTYIGATAKIIGEDIEHGDPCTGTALILDHNRLLTNRHVVKPLKPGFQIHT